MKKGAIGGVSLAVIIIVALICMKLCLVKIPAGYVGVVYNFSSGISGDTLSQGWHLVSPTKKVTTYSIGIEQSYLTSEDKVTHRRMRVSKLRQQMENLWL